MTDFAQSESLPLVPAQRFALAWAHGQFRRGRYYALKPQCGADASSFGEGFDIIQVPDTDTDTVPVLLHGFTLHLYTNPDLAESRARRLGTGILVIDDLLSFCRQASDSGVFVDLVLDEEWHAELYCCRESGLRGVTHVRVADGDELFECTRCANTGDCDWTPYYGYSNANHAREFCRPVPFPFGKGFDALTAPGSQERQNQIEADTIRVYVAGGADVVVAANSAESSPGEPETYTAYVRPLREFGFHSVPADSLLLLRGEGVWVPVADWSQDAKWTARAWTGLGDTSLFLEELRQVTEDGCRFAFSRGPDWYLNHAWAELERGLRLQDEGRNGSLAIESGKRIATAAAAAYAENRGLDELASNIARFDTPEGLRAIVHTDRAAWHLEAGRSDAVRSETGRAIELLPEFGLPYYEKALVFGRRETSDVFEFYLKEALRLEPDYPPALYNLGVVAGWHHDHEAARALLERAAEIGKEPEYALYHIAKIYWETGDLDRCDEFCDRALEVNRVFPDALRLKAELRFKRGELQEALAIGLEVLQADPLCSSAYPSVVSLALHLGRLQVLEYVDEIALRHAPWVSLPWAAAPDATSPPTAVGEPAGADRLATDGDRRLGRTGDQGGATR